jgi:hydrogenase/urease accessory protein HupE
MKAITCLLFAAVFALLAEPALAHPPPLGIPGFFGGLLHPLYVTAHITAVFGLGLLIGQQSDWGRAAPGAAIIALWVGLGVLTFGVVPRGADLAALVLSVTSGLLAALARPLPEWFGGVLAAAAGLAVGLDSPPEVVSLSEANLMLIGTGLSGTILLVLAGESGRQFRRGWHRIAGRILGAWIAASAMLALAFRLAG